MLQLTRKVQQAFAALDEHKANYDKAKAAVLTGFNFTEKTYMQRFCDVKRNKGEPYCELVIQQMEC